jgi:cytochrome b561
LVEQKYDSKTIFLHWLSAFCIFLLWALGQGIDLVPTGFYKINVRSFHICIGAIFFFVMMYRFYWRMQIKNQSEYLTVVATDLAEKFKLSCHYFLYLLAILTLLLGLIAVWYRGVNMFDLFRIPGVDLTNKFLRRLLVTIHSYLANGLMIAASFHFVVALWHHYFKKDSVLLNMLPMKHSPKNEQSI